MKKRLLYVVLGAMLAVLILLPSAFGQQTMQVKTETMEMTTEAPLPKSGGGPVGGSAVVLPAAAALLLGSGVLAYAALRRRR